MIYARRTVALALDGLRPNAGGAAGVERRVAGGNWMAALAFANAHYVSPAIYASLAAANRLGELPDDVRGYLALIHRQNALRNERLKEQAVELIRALNAAGLKPLLLKGGASLLSDLYDDPAARMLRDLDVLVPARARVEALATLRRLGYRAATLYPPGHHACGDFARPGDAGAVDLHFELIDLHRTLSARDVRRRASEVAVGRAEFLVPAPTDRVLHNILHAQIHYLGDYYRATIELRQLYEFAALSHRYGSSIDWDRIERDLRQRKLETPLFSWALAANRLFQTPWPFRRPPSFAARLHYARCMMQLRMPFFASLGVLFANMHAAFAEHRMDELYGVEVSLVRRRWRHMRQYLRKVRPSQAVRRFFRTA